MNAVIKSVSQRADGLFDIELESGDIIIAASKDGFLDKLKRMRELESDLEALKAMIGQPIKL